VVAHAAISLVIFSDTGEELEVEPMEVICD